MANVIEPNKIFAYFLRSAVSEITRQGLSNRQTNDTETFDGDGSTKTFTLTLQPVCINSAVVDGDTLNFFLDFDYDLDSKTITFVTAPANDTGNVVIDFDKGDNWVYPDFPRDDLAKASYPRIGVTTISEDGTQQGMPEDDTFDTVTFQIDVLAYKDQLCTIAGETKEGQDVAEYLARQVRVKTRSQWRTLLKDALFRPQFINNVPAPFTDNDNVFRRIVTISFEGFNIGE